MKVPSVPSAIPPMAALSRAENVKAQFKPKRSVGVPAQLGAKGVEKIWEIKLTDDERAALHKSAAAVKELVDVLKI